MITLTVNGKKTELQGPTSLKDYLEVLGVTPRFIAVAYNGSVLKKDKYASTVLKDGDELEIVRPVGGG